MSISVTADRSETPCSVCVAKHVREPLYVRQPQIISVGIASGSDDSLLDMTDVLMPGHVHFTLCVEHAHDLINALGFVYCSTTGTSVSKLLGVRPTTPRTTKKRKAKS